MGTAMALATALGRTSQVICSPGRGRLGWAGLRHAAAGRGELESERLPERAARGGETLGLGRTGLPGGPLDSGPQTHQPPRVPWGLGTLPGPTPSLAGCRACTYPSSHPRAAWKGQGRARDPGPRHQPTPPSAHAHRRATPGRVCTSHTVLCGTRYPQAIREAGPPSSMWGLLTVLMLFPFTSISAGDSPLAGSDLQVEDHPPSLRAKDA